MTAEWVSFAEVKAAVSMRLVLEDYGVLEKLRRSGGEQYRGILSDSLVYNLKEDVDDSQPSIMAALQ